jgi:hypothetical protein
VNTTIDIALAACRAHLAWELAERDMSITFQARMELCNYAQWLTRKALGEVADYVGVPRIILQSFSPKLVRADEKQCEAIVAEMLARAEKSPRTAQLAAKPEDQR